MSQLKTELANKQEELTHHINKGFLSPRVLNRAQYSNFYKNSKNKSIPFKFDTFSPSTESQVPFEF